MRNACLDNQIRFDLVEHGEGFLGRLRCINIPLGRPESGTYPMARELLALDHQDALAKGSTRTPTTGLIVDHGTGHLDRNSVHCHTTDQRRPEDQST